MEEQIIRLEALAFARALGTECPATLVDTVHYMVGKHRQHWHHFAEQVASVAPNDSILLTLVGMLCEEWQLLPFVVSSHTSSAVVLYGMSRMPCGGTFYNQTPIAH